MGIKRVTSSSPCLILAMRGFLTSSLLPFMGNACRGKQTRKVEFKNTQAYKLQGMGCNAPTP
eukprot:1154190-Pelagomonas_calceolata.AAC.1